MLRFKTADWKEGLKAIVPFSPIKSALPILAGILIMLKDKVLTMTASNLETSAKWTKEVEFNGNPDESFAVVLNAQHLKSIFEGLKSDKFQWELDNKLRARIYGDNFNHIVSGEAPDDFPIESDEQYIGEYELNSMHIGIIDRLKKFSNKDEIRRNMTGVHIDSHIAATDGYRLGAAFDSANLVNNVKVEKEKYYTIYDGEGERKVIQAKDEDGNNVKDEDGNSVYIITDMEDKEIRKAIPEEVENRVVHTDYEERNFGITLPLDICAKMSDMEKAKLQWTDAKIKVTSGSLEIFGNLIDETFPNFQSVIPSQESLINSFTVNRKLLIDNVNAIHSSSDSITKRIIFNFEGSYLTVSCENPDNGTESKITMDCKFKSEQYAEGYKTAFNYQFLLDMLSVLKAEFITIQFSMPSKAHLILSEPFTCILMPVRIENEVKTVPSAPVQEKKEEVKKEDDEELTDEEMTDEERQAKEIEGYISPNPDDEPIDFSKMEVVASEEVKSKKSAKKSVKKVKDLPPAKNKKEKKIKTTKKVA